MKIEVRDDYTIQLEEVYNPITIKTRDGVEFHICQRDYGIEVSCNGKTKYLDESLGNNKAEGDFLSTYNGWPIPKSDNDLVPYHTICGCNPANGGSGMCGCTMANTMVKKSGGINTTTSTNTVLKPLDEHNSEAWVTQTGWFSNEPRPNGIACPECGEELMDTNPNMTLTSYPAQKNVHCPKCGYTGYRIA